MKTMLLPGMLLFHSLNLIDTNDLLSFNYLRNIGAVATANLYCREKIFGYISRVRVFNCLNDVVHNGPPLTDDIFLLCPK